MQINVINSDWAVESGDLLGFITANLKETADGLPIVFADAYAAEGLLEILDVRVARGEREILVMDCTRGQVQAVLEWQSCDDDELLKDLEIHLVRKA